MSKRQALMDELTILQDKDVRTVKVQMRIKEICKQLNCCICRECDKEYDEATARGDLKGFCSAKCQHAMSKRLGYKPKSKNPMAKAAYRSEYDVLKRAGQVGSVFKVT